MFERFTDRARRVVVLGQENARLFNHHYVGTEHLLAGMLHEGEGIAAQVLQAKGASLSDVKFHIDRVIGAGTEPPTAHIPFTPRVKKVFELSLREALQLGHNYIGTEHLLLGLIREARRSGSEGVGAKIMGWMGVSLDDTRSAVLESMHGAARQASVTTPKPTALKHDTPENKKIAEENLILRCQVGSGLHGIAVPGTDDRDEMGLCIEPAEYVIGLKKFEQYEYRTQLMHVRSGPGDLDYTCYSLRKWAKLAAGGNPTVLLPLFAYGDDLLDIKWPGHDLRARRYMFLSRAAGGRFIGYLERQRDRMMGLLAQRTNRPELVEVHGFDTKFGAHAVRLGIQGVELLSTGAITLPIAEPQRTHLLDIRLGKHTKAEVLDEIERLRLALVSLCQSSPLPETADYPGINAWLSETYEAWWRDARE